MSDSERIDSHSNVSRQSLFMNWWKSPLLWGGLASVLFYASLPLFPFQRELLVRYCTSHPLEYVTMGLFFLGMATLVIRWIELSGENSAVSHFDAVLQSVSENPESRSRRKVELLRELLSQARQSIQCSIAGRTVQEGLDYVSQRPSGEKLEEHLRHFSDLEHDLAQRKLGFVNTVSWAVPILGFLGTVMGITLAIANVTPDQLDQSLPEVTGGLAVAFDTTALSLTLSLGLVFTTYLIRNRQEEILNKVDQQLDSRLCFLLQTDTERNFLGQQETIAQNLAEASQQVIEQAGELWKTRLDDLQQRMLESIDREHHHFIKTLQSGVQGTLESHQSHLMELRKEEQQLSLALGTKLETAIANWNHSLNDVREGISSQTEHLREHTSLIVNLVDKQQQLTELQQQLHASLDASQITSTLDQTLNALTAAIQLLNAKVNVQNRAA